jgi:hypothetical protein
LRATSRRRATRQHAHSSSTARYPCQGAGESLHCPIHPPRGRRAKFSHISSPAPSEWLCRRHRQVASAGDLARTGLWPRRVAQHI